MVLYYKKSTVLLSQNQGLDTSKVLGSINDLTKKKQTISIYNTLLVLHLP
jgi:hypothetical protein